MKTEERIIMLENAFRASLSTRIRTQVALVERIERLEKGFSTVATRLETLIKAFTLSTRARRGKGKNGEL